MKRDANPDVSAALFVSLERDFLGNGTPCVLRFPTEADAQEWAYRKLLEVGELVVDKDGVVWSSDHTTRYLDSSDAVDQWQDSLGPSEYFHIYECRDIGF